jgi:hypothetical protein
VGKEKAPNPSPYQPPEAWVDAFARLPELHAPRIIVALSAGRAAYRAILDVSPVVMRVPNDAHPEDATRDTIIVRLGDDYLEGDTRDAAETLYSATLQLFLDSRTRTEQPVRYGRLRMQLLDGPNLMAEHAHDVLRESFGEPDTVVDGAGSPNISDTVASTLREHAKMVGQQFIVLARQNAEQARADRNGIIETARGALELVKDASDYKVAAASQLAAASANDGGFLSTDAGMLLVTTAVEQVEPLFNLASKWLDVRLEEARAKREGKS